MIREQAKAIIEKLVERYAEHRNDYHLVDYNEQKARQDFINPFFKALGWDIDNEKGDSEAYREVIYEDKVVVKGKTKAPDYGFRLTGSGEKRLFYVEAKKPSVQIKINKESAYQLRRYGSSAQAHVSILTNFEDFIIYDCSKVPNLNDSATVARLKHIGFEDYVNQFDFLYDTFSHEAVTKGRFDKYVQASANKKGTDTLDKRFVESLDQWRKYLATSIALNNKKINDEELNFAVQQTIDRLIFLRFCEDRSVEPYGQLQVASAKGDAYKNLLNLFQQADDKYNSGLFDFEKDKITQTLKVDNKVIKTVVDELYYPKCNFEFSVMPVEILGNAYEQFLGKVIRITPLRGVKIEEKPEVRKAGGVYYTPQYIVDYIVKNTVGKLIDGKAPKEISEIKIVDPACGSGSFLLGAFVYLLNYHANWYHQKGYATKKGKDNPFTPHGTLTTHEKKRILLNNIYGVDLDANAVEVSKLSLLLKCMEGETEASIKQQITMFHEHVLPDLDNNIKDGNSLIDTDIYDTAIDFGEEKKIKPFSWKKQFSTVFKQGGFNVVIGNPPYVGIKGQEEVVKNYIKEKYLYSKGADLYVSFLETGINILRNNGLLGYIVPNKFFGADYGKSIREELRKKLYIELILDEKDKKIFKDALISCIALVIVKQIPNIKLKTKVVSDDKEVYIDYFELFDSRNKIQIESNSSEKLIISKLEKETPLSKLANVRTGIMGFEYWKMEKIIKNEGQLNNENIPIYTNGNFNRYQDNWKNQELSLYKKKYKTPTITLDTNYINKNTIDLFTTKPKILVRGVAQKTSAIIDNIGSAILVAVHSIIPFKENQKYIIGIINSKLINWYHLKTIYSIRIPEGSLKYPVSFFNNIPIPTIGKESLKSDIIKHVDILLKLNEEIKTEKLQTKIEQIKQRIEHSEDKINQLVYELYELTPEEIKIIEGGNSE